MLQSPTQSAIKVALYTKTWMSSGSGLFAQELVVGMAESGGHVLSIAPPAQDERFEVARRGVTRFQSRRERLQGSRARRIIASLARVMSSAIGCARARQQTRIFIVTIPDPLIFALPMLAALRLSGARIIYVVHDPLPHAWKLPRWLRTIENMSFAVAYRLSHGLVVLSDSAREALVRAYSLGTRPVQVIEHGVFVLGRPSPAPGTGELLVFGTLRRNKGIREAIAGTLIARRRGAAVRLIIAGAPDPVEPQYWAECEALARLDPDAVTLEIGYVTDDRLQELISRSDAFLLPYRDFHSQSGVAMVAASNGRAVIASRSGGIGDLIADGMAAVPISQPVDEHAVAEAICAFTTVPIDEWNARAATFRAKTIESRAWPAIGAQYLAFAKQIAGFS